MLDPKQGPPTLREWKGKLETIFILADHWADRAETEEHRLNLESVCYHILQMTDRDEKRRLAQEIENEHLRSALIELVEVATLRDDNDLPHPADDDKKWTARMQEAWNTAEELVDALAPAQEKS